MISEMIEEDARRLDDIVADLNKEAIRHRNARDDYNRQAQVLADKRDKLRPRPGSSPPRHPSTSSRGTSATYPSGRTSRSATSGTTARPG